MLEWFGYYSQRLDHTVWMPPGFVLDFASIPRMPLAFLVMGNTMHWEAAIHDLFYRWPLIGRVESDLVFFEAGKVRSESRENQGALYRFGRWKRRTIATGIVLGFGWPSFKSKGGCLDHRRCPEIECAGCDNYFPEWKNCYKPGYHPVIDLVVG